MLSINYYEQSCKKYNVFFSIVQLGMKFNGWIMGYRCFTNHKNIMDQICFINHKNTDEIKMKYKEK